MDLRLTKDKMKSFWEYGKLRVIVAVLISIALFYTLYQITRPVLPAGERFDILHGGVYDEAGYRDWADKLLDGVLLNQKQVNIEAMGIDELGTQDGQLVVVTRITSQEGDMFLLPYHVYQALAKGGNMLNLEAPIPGDPEGRSVLDRLNFPPMADAESCRVTVTDPATGETSRQIGGINVSRLMGLMQIGIVPMDYVLCTPAYNNVDYENFIRAAQWIMDTQQEYTPLATATTTAANKAG